VKIIEYLKQAGDRNVTVSELVKDLKLDTVTIAIMLRDLRAKGTIEVPGSSDKKGQRVLKPEVKDKVMDTFK